ncbi:MAG: cyclic nucleotide-binding domain-containing protein [Candidatus Latescibacteria bacterium]|jgi:CRP-like cAMP-binding protein|nr:cyclic nucleotide-binding domain-containing protein [Candidatus Latescibacterota bacterium]
MAKIDVTRHIKIVEKIPFVKNLSIRQIQQVLKAGNLETHPFGASLFRQGDKSLGLYILLAGELVVQDGNTEIARVKPVDIVGEMGVVSNEPRSATIKVTQEATLISVSKMQFDVLLKNDVDMAARIFRNMLDSLIGKLRSTNEHIKSGVL